MYRFNRSEAESSNLQSFDTSVLFSSVLLIEDDQAHATLIQRALSGVVGEVHHASSGRAGLEVLSQELIELVFCDFHLPDSTGIELIQKIRALRPGVPIIIITSSGNLGDAVDAMREGAWDFMVKQFSGDLQGTIKLTVQRIAERKLQQLREFEVRAERDAFSVAAFTAQDGLAIVSESGRVVFANEAFNNFCKLAGSELPEGATNINLVELIKLQSETVAAEMSKELNAVTSGSMWSSELEVARNEEGETSHAHNYELTLSTVSSRQLGDFGFTGEDVPHLRYHVVWIRDITRRKEQERFQRDLLSTTTHDLKGPLGAILTSAELLSDSEYDVQDKAPELLTRIASCARNSISIIDELLSARRIQDGVLVVRPRWYPLECILEDAVLDYLPMAKAKQIQFGSRPIDASVQVYADKIALNRVLGNLVSNALKFTPAGGSVELSAEHVGSEVRLSVSDTGPGIEAEARHLLFERFSRLEKHADIEGTGLGLFVTKNIIEAHNGKIQVKSQIGKGTTFIVTLPDGPDENASPQTASE